MPEDADTPEPKFEAVLNRDDGITIYRKENGIGGHIYLSDEVGGGVFLWDTSLVHEDSLCDAISLEWARVAEEDKRERR